MTKIFSFVLLIVGSMVMKAQYGSINAILDKLEARRGINQNLKDVNIDNTKFVLIKEFDDHTERSFIIIKGNLATYVEIFEEKKNGKTSSNFFWGDVVRKNHNILSLRADKLEGTKIAIPIAKTFLMTKQKEVLYLADINTKDRWIEEGAINKK